VAENSKPETNVQLLARVRRYCIASCVLTIGVGGMVLYGWIADVGVLKSVLPGMVTMKINTALCLIFLSTGLLLQLRGSEDDKSRMFGTALGLLVCCIGGATISEYIFHAQLGIDQLFMPEARESFATSSPGRMAPTTATAFLALGMAIGLLNWKTRLKQLVSQLLCIWGALMAMLALTGYLYHATVLYRIFAFTQIALHTAVCLFVISIAIFLARPTEGIAGDLTGRFPGSVMARRFLPAVFFVPIFVGWIRLRGQRAGWYGTELGLALYASTNVVVFSLLVWLNAIKMNKSEQFLEEARGARARYYNASLKDELTGLYNRRGFMTFAEGQVKLASSGRRELLVVFADVDGLKGINDEFGHGEGDEAVKLAAEVLRRVFRDTDVVARLGGDEFAVLALDCSSAGLKRIRGLFDKTLMGINEKPRRWKLSISMGTLHVNSSHKMTIAELLEQADEVMYARKRSRPGMPSTAPRKVRAEA
jgi:diguanylate cyclase (GGDEF)-like protein